MRLGVPSPHEQISTQAKGKGRRRRLSQEGNRTLLGFLAFAGSVHRARAQVDGDIEITLASFAVAGPQLGSVLAGDVNQAKIVLLEGPFSPLLVGKR